MLKEAKQKIINYAYAGFIINEVRGKFKVSVPTRNKNVIHTTDTLVQAKIYIDSFTETEQKKIIKTEGRYLLNKENK